MALVRLSGFSLCMDLHILFQREFPYIYVRNFLFVGIPYFCIGDLFYKHKSRLNRCRKRFLIAMIILFSATSFLERYILVSAGLNATRDHYISTTFLSIAVFGLTLGLPEKQPNMRFFAKIGRKYSTWLYILHPIVIAILGIVIKRVGIYSGYQYVAPVAVFAVTLMGLVILERCRKCKRGRK